MIRYFCRTDDSAAGELAAAYAHAMTRELRVRAIATRSMQFDPKGPWAKLVHLFVAPLEFPFVNVIAADPDDWHRLYTANVRNVIIALGDAPAPNRLLTGVTVRTTKAPTAQAGAELLAHGGALVADIVPRFDVVIVPPAADLLRWSELGAKQTIVIPPSEASALRLALLP